jgi:hypothetical protein
MSNEENKRTEVVYLCDRKKCKDCSYPICTHTSDIEHAKNFECTRIGALTIYSEKGSKENANH